MSGCVARVKGLLSLNLSSRGGEGSGTAASEHRDAYEEQRGRAHSARALARRQWPITFRYRLVLLYSGRGHKTWAWKPQRCFWTGVWLMRNDAMRRRAGGVKLS